MFKSRSTSIKIETRTPSQQTREVGATSVYICWSSVPFCWVVTGGGGGDAEVGE